MKIIHVSAFALRGGCEMNCFRFIEGSRDLEHEVLVLDREGPMSGEWRTLAKNVTHLDILRLNILQFTKVLANSLHGCQSDKVIIWTTVRLSLQLHVLQRVSRSIVVHLGNPPRSRYSGIKDGVLSNLFTSVADVRFIACSSYVAKSYRRAFFYRQFQIETSLNPIKVKENFEKREANGSEFKIGMVARLDPIKRHSTVIRAFSEFVRKVPGAKLYFVGDGVLRQELENSVRENGVSSSVFFYGEVKDVSACLNDWDLFVYDTTYSEGLGIAVEEAMGSGLPCALADLPMLRELAPLEGLVEWFESGNDVALLYKMEKLYFSPDYRVKLGKAGYEHAKENFGVGRFVRDYLK